MRRDEINYQMLCTPCRHLSKSRQGKGRRKEERSSVQEEEEEEEEAKRPRPRLIAGYIAENAFMWLCFAAICFGGCAALLPTCLKVQALGISVLATGPLNIDPCWSQRMSITVKAQNIT